MFFYDIDCRCRMIVCLARLQSSRRNLQVLLVSRAVMLILHRFSLRETITRRSAVRRLGSHLRQKIPGMTL